MRPAVLLVQLALWATAEAFFPYTPQWMERGVPDERRWVATRGPTRLDLKQRSGQSAEPVLKRAADEAIRLKTKYLRRKLSKGEAEALSKRFNTYNVQKAEDPGRKLSQGINQDGTDYSYFIEAQIGSKGKKIYMLVDTGAGSSWIMGSKCSSKACGMHNSFGSSDSDTLQTTDKSFSIAYGSGKVTGSLVTDTISIAGMSFKYQFGLATTTSDQFVQFAFDGILGLGIKDGANENFLSVMDEANAVDSNIFCVALNRASDGTNRGEISFGSINTDKFSGDIAYSGLTHGDDWAINVDDMAYNGKKAGVGGIVAYIDTGTSFIFGPEDLVKKLHANIPGASSSDGTTYSVPCDSSGTLTFTFAGVGYEVSASDWISPKNTNGVCTSNIYGHEVVKGAWLLGDTFLKNVYAVFDKDKRRIGFAKSAIAGNSTDTSVASTSTTSGGSSTASASSTSKSTGTSMSDATTTTKADLGLGNEQVTSGTAAAAAGSATETDTKDSSSYALTTKLEYAFAPLLMTLFALMV